MNKNIIIAILAVTSILAIVYGQYEKMEAEKWEAAAVVNEKRAHDMAEGGATKNCGSQSNGGTEAETTRQ